ncbi:hypothetical protein [Actinomyces qiguomingii]|uniref:hypothetical protein n=1 Tax=Actinomyces qiguomingii TaxID=2057800 RepID=UPI000FFE729B|nr:hypothetical protein [Actinomyces qiguomingii]
MRAPAGSGTIIKDGSSYVATMKISTGAGRSDVMVMRSRGDPRLANRMYRAGRRVQSAVTKRHPPL